MSRTKVKELTPHMREHDPNCSICHPRADRLREDQVWGSCPTNVKHPHHPKAKSETSQAVESA